MSHHEEGGSRHGYDAELVAEELRKPTREQIAAVLDSELWNRMGDAKYSKWDTYEYRIAENLADALLREYEIRVKEEKNG